jgi:hypothetical protein
MLDSEAKLVLVTRLQMFCNLLQYAKKPRDESTSTLNIVSTSLMCGFARSLI